MCKMSKQFGSSPLTDSLPDSYARFIRAVEVVTTDADPEVGPTPKQVIWTKNKSTLYRFVPNQKKNFRVPLLMVYALINKPYILDLTKGNSLIEYLTDQGFDVYLLEWGEPGLEDKDMQLDDYIMEYIPRAIRKVLRTSGAKECSLLGYCMGGTMSAIFAALHPDVPIKNLVFLTSPFDFENSGLYGSFVDERYFDIDKVVETLGLIPGDMIDFGNKMLKPITNFYGPYVSLVDRADNETFIESWKLMQKWVSDGVPFAGGAYKQWIRDFYQHNKLIKGTLKIRGTQVDLKQINASVLNLAADRDHIAQPHQVKALMDVISSEDKEYRALPTGHVSVVFGKKAVAITYPTIGDWLAERSS
ncbi:class III poly(R)-hydroxyalkanoic acid synthase subunit PhaC [Alkalicoccobacillus porphyridii]|uniref:Poly(3-hydroxyalkanoate) polymerase subunit PhaC n=1 Tax=Alkalicoccobacillus porphyridii TaxID=2597270 RepID=A0A553ZZG9_9BACI|nr:class III poly(R)-hydroxyalkanoic acid synthase subunit PhaC [Alkalicoccobacillus porphyridii]